MLNTHSLRTRVAALSLATILAVVVNGAVVLGFDALSSSPEAVLALGHGTVQSA